MGEETPDIRFLVGQPYGDAPILIECPFHEDDTASYAVYPDGGWCFGCHRRESREDFATRLGAVLGDLPVSRELRRSEVPTDDVASIRDLPLMVRVWKRVLNEGSRRSHIAWLEDRGLWRKTIEQASLGHTGDRFAIPVFNGVHPVGYQLRLDPEYCSASDPKYLNLKGTGVLVYRPAPKNRVQVICEGPLDALLLSQYGYDAITTTGGAGSLALTLKQAFPKLGKQLFVVTDQDEAGKEACAALIGAYPQATPVEWEGAKDITEWLLGFGTATRSRALKQLIGA